MSVKLNLGCGYRKIEGYINIDIRPEVGPDMVLDISEGLPYDNEIDEIRAVDFLEHVPIGRTISTIESIWKALKHHGKFYSVTPSTDGRGAFQDPTHVSFWNKNSFWYYMDDEHRNLYGIKAKFIGELRDVITDPANKIHHVEAILYAVKGK